MNHPAVKTAELTCIACPEQWEGELHDGRFFYFRYRSGMASLALGHSADYVGGRMDYRIRVGDYLDGSFESEELRDSTFAELFRMADSGF